MRFARAILSLATLSAAVAMGGEIAVLHTGFTMRADKIECAGATCVLTSGAGRIELPASSIARIETEPEPERAAAPSPGTAPDPPPAEALKAKSPKEIVDEMARRHGLPPEIVHSVAQVESAYRTGAVSPKGAIGVMQLMPATARQLNADPHDAVQNIEAGTRLLRDLLIQYENTPNPVRRALAAYNAGAGAVARYGGVPPFRETQLYVEKVLERYWKLVKAR